MLLTSILLHKHTNNKEKMVILAKRRPLYIHKFFPSLFMKETRNLARTFN